MIWPLLDKLRIPLAFQQRPKVTANQGLVRLPTMPWDDPDRPGAPWYGQVESSPKLWELAPWFFGLSAIGIKPIEIKLFKTNPRALFVSEQRHEPGVIHQLGLWQFLGLPTPPKDDRQANPILWPLKSKLFNPGSIVINNTLNLKTAVRSLVYDQQRPSSAANLKVTQPPVLPYARLNYSNKPPIVRPQPLPARIWTISGFTKDSSGNLLGNCSVFLFLTNENRFMESTTSDAFGAYTFKGAASTKTHYIVAYHPDTPDVAGTTIDTLIGI